MRVCLRFARHRLLCRRPGRHDAPQADRPAGIEARPLPAAGLAPPRPKPVAAGQGTGNRLYDIQPGHADGSVLLYRMDSNEPSVMMPEVGRSIAHREGVTLIRQWIDAQHGSCDAGPGVSASAGGG